MHPTARGGPPAAFVPAPRPARRPRRVEPPVVAGSKYAYSVSDTAYLTGLSRSTIYEQLGNGSLGSIVVGSRRLITAQQLEEFLAGRVTR